MSISIFSLPFHLSPQELLVIDQRIKEFKVLGTQGNKAWFSELCFCLLTANAQAKKAIAIQEAVGDGFLTLQEHELATLIRTYGHRFHNTKAQYIVLARMHKTIKDTLKNMNSQEAREFLVTTIKGLGYKEASHFLRNVGYEDRAIIDRHIIRFLVQYNFIKGMPKSITKSIYFELEELLKKFGIPLNRLDLMIWYHMTGVVLK